MSEQKLRALLAEAREIPDAVGMWHGPKLYARVAAVLERIDAALAEPVKDDFKRGAEAMREAAAQVVDDLLSHTLTDAADRIRALPVPEDKP